jgi:hypothetical protein
MEIIVIARKTSSAFEAICWVWGCGIASADLAMTGPRGAGYTLSSSKDTFSWVLPSQIPAKAGMTANRPHRSNK